MKLGIYLKESWYNLRKDRVYSAVYIIGTGLSLALVTAFLTVQSMYFDNSRPEVYRDRMMIIPNLSESHENGNNANATLGREFIDRFLLEQPIEGVEAITAIRYKDISVSNEDEEVVNAVANNVDEKFWNVFEFDFLHGRAMVQASFDLAVPEAVLSESFARDLYGRSDVVGKSIFVNGREYKVCGVARDVPQSATLAFAQLWLPDIDSNADAVEMEQWIGRKTMLGNYFAIVLAKERSCFDDIRKTVEDRLERYNNSADAEWKLTLNKGIPSVRDMAFVWTGITSSAYTWIGAAVMFFILLIPMINLTGMVGSRMETRMGEFGLRKSFGAWPGAIVRQIAGENLLLTLSGGVVGLILSSMLLMIFPEQFSQMIPARAMAVEFSMFDIDTEVLSFRDLFKVKIYLILLAIVLVLNIISALIPAWKVIRRPITDSLNSKK